MEQMARALLLIMGRRASKGKERERKDLLPGRWDTTADASAVFPGGGTVPSVDNSPRGQDGRGVFFLKQRVAF